MASGGVCPADRRGAGMFAVARDIASPGWLMAVSLSAVSSSVAVASRVGMTRWMYRRRGATVCPSWRTPHLRRNHQETAFLLWRLARLREELGEPTLRACAVNA